MENVLPEWAHDTLSVSTVRVSETPIVYLHGGSGPPVIMLHGLGGSLDWWQKNVAELSRHFTLYLVDLPGFGRLGHLEDSWSIPDFVDWIKEFITAIGLTKTHLIGHSMGGHLAIRLAASWPERFDRLVLVAPAGVLPDAELVHYILPVIKLLRELPPSLLPLALRDVRRADLRTTWRSAHHLIEHDVLHLLADVQSPCLLIWGSDDLIVPADLADTFLEKLPDARLTIFPDAGHFPMVDGSEQFDRDVLAFLQATVSSSASPE